MTNEDLIAAQDQQRTVRSFISFLSGAFGVDQSMAGADGYTTNRPGQYLTVTPYGQAVEGQPISNVQSGGVFLSLPMLLLMGGAAFLVLKK